MTVPLRKDDIYVTPEDYVAREECSETKHEYLAGMIYAMAGASREHNTIMVNLLRELGNQLRGKKCAPYGSDMRLRIQHHGATFFYYPDVTVDCSGSDSKEVEEPAVIFEILSPATERADCGDKLLNYQSLPSMRAYVLVDQYRASVTVYRRREGNGWAMEFLGHVSETLELPEIECRIPLAAIYERVPSVT